MESTSSRPGFSEAPQVEALNELRQWRLPPLLSLIRELIELPRIKPKFPSHLNLCVGQVKTLAGLYPDLEAAGILFLAIVYVAWQHSSKDVSDS